MNDDAKLDAQMPNSVLSHIRKCPKGQAPDRSFEKGTSLLRTYTPFWFLILIGVTTSVKWRVAGRPGWLSQFLLA